MLIIYNCLGHGGVLALQLVPFNEQVYYERMKQHGIGPTYSQWLVPGTF
jgi:hypothetical protein